MEVQTRTESGGLNFFESLQEAFEYAEKDSTVCKVSFNVEDGSRCRLVRSPVSNPFEPCWVFDPIITDPRLSEDKPA